MLWSPLLLWGKTFFILSGCVPSLPFPLVIQHLPNPINVEPERISPLGGQEESQLLQPPQYILNDRIIMCGVNHILIQWLP